MKLSYHTRNYEGKRSLNRINFQKTKKFFFQVVWTLLASDVRWICFEALLGGHDFENIFFI